MTRTRFALLLATLVSILTSETLAQTVIRGRPHETLEVELHAIRDKLTLYMGEPQELLRLECRPRHVEPRVEYSPQSRAKLTIRDPGLFQTRTAEPGKEIESSAQTWEARLYPSGPTTFRLQIDRGEGILDFTDFEVQEVQLRGPGSVLEVEFGRQNPMPMDVFAAIVENGSFEFRKALNARAKTMAFSTPGSTARLEFKGKPYDGETSVVFEGAAEELSLVLSKKVGWHISGPAEVLTKFGSKNVAPDGASVVSPGFADASCKIRLSFSEMPRKLRVDWD